MTAMKLDSYWHAITRIEAQDTLVALKVADFPNLQKGDRESYHKEIFGKAYPSPKRGRTTAEIAARMREYLG